jgi:hypothetical protein
MKQMILTLALVSLFILPACSANYAVTQQNPASGYPFRHSDFDYKIAWKTTQVNNAVVVDGILKNVRYQSIESLELTVLLLGAGGKVRARATAIPIPQESRINDVISFSAQLHDVAINPGDTLRFEIQYEGEDDGEGIDWLSTFSADAMTGEPRHKANLKPEEW